MCVCVWGGGGGGGQLLVCTVVKTSLSFPVQEVAELQQQLLSFTKQLQFSTEQLRKKEAELTRAEETIRREQQEMWQQVSDCVVCVVTRGPPDYRRLREMR